MNNSIHAGSEPSYPATDDSHDTANTQGGVTYDLGFACVVVLFISILCYSTYKYKYKKGSQSSPSTRTTTSRTTANQDSDTDDSNSLTHSNGFDDGVLATLPTFLYSEAVKPGAKRFDMGSGCSICLDNYKPTDVLRLLPECGHLFHVICVDSWLKIHSTCPVCRKSPLPTELT